MKNILPLCLAILALSTSISSYSQTTQNGELPFLQACVESAYRNKMMPLEIERDAVLRAQSALQLQRMTDPRLSNQLTPEGRKAEYESAQMAIKSLDLDREILFLGIEKADVMREFGQICLGCTEQEEYQSIATSIQARFPGIAWQCQ